MEPEWSSTRTKFSGIRTWAIISVGIASTKTYATWLPPVTGMKSFPTSCASVTSPDIIYKLLSYWLDLVYHKGQLRLLKDTPQRRCEPCNPSCQRRCASTLRVRQDARKCLLCESEA